MKEFLYNLYKIIRFGRGWRQYKKVNGQWRIYSLKNPYMYTTLSSRSGFKIDLDKKYRKND